MSGKIFDAMALVQEYNKEHGVKQRGGKMYTQVVHRMEAFRQIFGLEFGTDTTVLVDDGHRVVVKAIITNENGMVIGSGMAEEIRGEGHVNKTSALENCETSAVGRALASIGLSGGEYASANEMDAVGRKEQNLTSQAGNSSAQGSPPPSASVSAPPSEPAVEKGDEESDRQLYMYIADQLQGMRTKKFVEQYFLEMKPKIKEVRERSEERAQHLLDLFQKRIAQL